MNKARSEVLGENKQKKGSLVDPGKTRFDFAHAAPVSAGEIREVEARVNAEILANTANQATVMALEAAQKSGAMMLFGEKYDEIVRVVSIGTSRELCGGTHVMRTGDIGLFKILSESGIAAGVRRIEAVTSDAALRTTQTQEQRLTDIAALLKAQPEALVDRVSSLLEQARALEKEVIRLKSKLVGSQIGDLVEQAVEIEGGARLLTATLGGIDPATLRETLDKLKDRLKSAVIVLATVRDEKVSLIAGVTADLTGKIKAGELVNFVARQVGGKGGGRADMAQAGGAEPEKLAGAMGSVLDWVNKH
jgi:alanyl-tRNA synthetase